MVGTVGASVGAGVGGGVGTGVGDGVAGSGDGVGLTDGSGDAVSATDDDGDDSVAGTGLSVVVAVACAQADTTMRQSASRPARPSTLMHKRAPALSVSAPRQMLL